MNEKLSTTTDDYVNDLFEKRIILIDREMNEQTCSEWIGKICLLDLNSKNKKPIILMISSYGGDTHCSLALADVIKNCVSPVITVCIGVAYSSGSIVLSSGTKRFSVPNGTIMLHQHTANYGDMKHTEMLNEVEASKRTFKQLEDYYVEVTGLPNSKVKKLLEKDSYLTADDALALGLIDEIGFKLHEWLK